MCLLLYIYRTPPTLASSVHATTSITPQVQSTAVEGAAHEYDEMTRESLPSAVYSVVGKVTEERFVSKTTQEPEYDQPDMKVQR